MQPVSVSRANTTASNADMIKENGRESDDEVTRTDVYQEFDALRSKYGIEEWRAKFVNRKYAFEDQTVTRGESEWMKVVYGFNGGLLGVSVMLMSQRRNCLST